MSSKNIGPPPGYEPKNSGFTDKTKVQSNENDVVPISAQLYQDCTYYTYESPLTQSIDNLQINDTTDVQTDNCDADCESISSTNSRREPFNANMGTIFPNSSKRHCSEAVLNVDNNQPLSVQPEFQHHKKNNKRGGGRYSSYTNSVCTDSDDSRSQSDRLVQNRNTVRGRSQPQRISRKSYSDRDDSRSQNTGRGRIQTQKLSGSQMQGYEHTKSNSGNDNNRSDRSSRGRGNHSHSTSARGANNGNKKHSTPMSNSKNIQEAGYADLALSDKRMESRLSKKKPKATLPKEGLIDEKFEKFHCATVCSKIKIIPFSELKTPILKKISSINEDQYVHEVAYFGNEPTMSNDIGLSKFKKEISIDIDIHELHPYQMEALKVVELGHDLLVCAPTSAGKTIVAQFAMSHFKEKRIFYTSPIKALSNQKFSQFEKIYKEDVGLVTGDASKNTEGRIVLMTTEILHEFLQKDGAHSNDFENVGWVVFDEFHYISDEERGFAYEEIIILLPREIKIIFLTTNISNTSEIISYVSRIRQHPCHCIISHKRPIPLEMYLVQGDAMKKFENAKNLREHLLFFGRKSSKANSSLYIVEQNVIRGTRNCRVDRSIADTIIKLSNSLKERDLLPVIVFCFNRLDCELLLSLMAKKDFTSADEKKEINEIIEENLNAPAFEKINSEMYLIKNPLECIRKGMAIHHSGLIPAVKEITEKLFEQNKIKVLFATDTFSTGVNMPARTVIISNLIKYDGNKSRLIRKDEFTHMAGRAGRRRDDDQGIVIVILNKEIQKKSNELQGIFFGDEMRLDSRYHLSVSMILNHYNPEQNGYRVDDMIQRSFLAFQCREQDDYTRLQVLNRMRKNLLKFLQFKGFIENEDFDEKASIARSLSNFGLIESEILEKIDFRNCTHVELVQMIICLMYRQKSADKTLDNAEASNSSNLGTMLKMIDDYQKYFDTEIRKDVCAECKGFGDDCFCSQLRILKDFAPTGAHCLSLVKAAESWMNGKSFTEVYGIANSNRSRHPIFEGNIIRAFRDCEDILLKLIPAADTENGKKSLTEAYQKIHRDVVAASSIFVEKPKKKSQSKKK